MPKGQGLIESIIALSILITGVAGSLALVVSIVRSSRDNLQEFLAQSLAAESIEVATNLRDTAFLTNDDFLLPFQDGIDKTAILVIDPLTNHRYFNFAADSLADPVALVYRQDGFYRQDGVPLGGDETGFRRLVTFDTATTGKVGVTSIVTWTQNAQERTVTIRKDLYDWR